MSNSTIASFTFNSSTYELTKTSNELTNTIELTTTKTPSYSNEPFTHGDVLDVIQTLLIIILIVFVLFIYCKWRTSENDSAEIRIEDKDQRLVLIFLPKNRKKKRNIEIHQANCMCSARRSVNPLYTPLQTQNEVQTVNQTNENTTYMEVV
eukprot:XP_019926159.1 PREDICTED: uncharacterized protein LOC109619748 [Crassostrea gigas]